MVGPEEGTGKWACSLERWSRNGRAASHALLHHWVSCITLEYLRRACRTRARAGWFGMEAGVADDWDKEPSASRHLADVEIYGESLAVANAVLFTLVAIFILRGRFQREARGGFTKGPCILSIPHPISIFQYS